MPEGYSGLSEFGGARQRVAGPIGTQRKRLRNISYRWQLKSWQTGENVFSYGCTHIHKDCGVNPLRVDQRRLRRKCAPEVFNSALQSLPNAIPGLPPEQPLRS